ncbi:MAG: NERD domain-containing protein [Kiritimatiellia bacterium]
MLLTIVILFPLAVLSLALGAGTHWGNGGNWGERMVRESLMGGLSDEYCLFNDLYLPLPDGSTTQVDHVVVSRYGVFVIETKSYSGWIFGRARSAFWTQVRYRKKYQFQNPLRQNYLHICALAKGLGLPRNCFQSVVAFTESCKFRTPMPPKVVWSSQLTGYIRAFDSVVLSAARVQQIVEAIVKLSESLDASRIQRHVLNLQARHSALSRENPRPNCPCCGRRMVLRTNRKTGEGFYGCPGYPSCKGTRALQQDE